MAEDESTRRRLLTGAAATGAAWAAAHCCGDHVAAVSAAVTGLAGRAPDDIAVSPIVLADGLSIRPRASWGADLAPNGSMRSEDVRFLLVHHTASEFGNDDPVRAIRSVYAFHTGPAKRWPDVAYNFFVAPDGSVWEGRAGSLDGPVEASATGGNQGFAQLVCLIGNHVRRPPTLQAQASLVRLLAWLCGRYGLGVHAGASATFTSRGSNRFPSGSTITTPIISPHRAVTFTACPGDAAVALLADWRRAVFDLVSATWERDGLQRASRLALGRP